MREGDPLESVLRTTSHPLIPRSPRSGGSTPPSAATPDVRLLPRRHPAARLQQLSDFYFFLRYCASVEGTYARALSSSRTR
jgi:hypothetical protein